MGFKQGLSGQRPYVNSSIYALSVTGACPVTSVAEGVPAERVATIHKRLPIARIINFLFTYTDLYIANINVVYDSFLTCYTNLF